MGSPVERQIQGTVSRVYSIDHALVERAHLRKNIAQVLREAGFLALIQRGVCSASAVLSGPGLRKVDGELIVAGGEAGAGSLERTEAGEQPLPTVGLCREFGDERWLVSERAERLQTEGNVHFILRQGIRKMTYDMRARLWLNVEVV